MNLLAERISRRLGSFKRRSILCAGLLGRLARYALVVSGIPVRKEFLVLRCARGRDASGLFSEFAAVLGLLEHYERWRKIYAGLQVDFADQGLYYEPAFGPNWWEYFFEPLEVGSRADARVRVVGDEQHDFFAYRLPNLSRQRGFDLIDRYIRAKPLIREKVDTCMRENARGAFVIGVHYRGTDKRADAPRVAYDEVRDAIGRIAQSVPDGRYRIFVATDEKPFLDYMLDLYPGRIFYREMFRSVDGRPIDVVNEDGNHRKGEDAVLDCLLLARCHHLIRTASNLSLCSILFNPSIQEISLNHEQAPERLWPSVHSRWIRLKRGLRLGSELFGRLSRYLLVAARIPVRKEYLVLGCRGDGFFSEFAAVLGALQHYEQWKPIYAGMRVQYADPGRYYDPAHGDNWWEYYFEPIELGSMEKAIATAVSDRRHDIFASGIARLMRREGFAIIERHIRPKPRILERIEAFAVEHFKNAFVIGIHYRGTDKFKEAPRVPYEHVRARILAAINTAKPSRCKLFLATDEQAFLEYMLAAFPDVLAYRQMFRSIDGEPIHGRPASRYDEGEHAVIDCLLLSRTDLLIRTASNLSLCATLFNPDLPVVLLNREL